MLRVELGDAPRERLDAVDLVVDVEPWHRVGEVVHAIAAHLGVPSGRLVSRRHGRVLDPDESVEGADLLSGDALCLTEAPDAVPRVAHAPQNAVTADVVGGHGPGESMFLFPGRYLIGSEATCDIVLGDPTVSGRHAVVMVADDWSVTVAPCSGRSNAVSLNTVAIEGQVVVTGDDVITLGNTRLAFRSYVRPDDHRVDRLGQIAFQRTPYRRPVVADRGTVTLGPVPRHAEPRRFQLLTMTAPLAAGLVLFVFSNQMQFLALTLMSPLVLIANVVEDRRSGRRTARDEVADFRDGLVERRCSLEALRASERVERLRAAPDLADLLRRAQLHSTDLWSRGRGVPDFLHLRLGVGTVATRFEIDLEHGGDERLRAEATASVDGLTRLEGVPVTVDLATCGVMAVHGDDGPVHGVMSSLVVQAACLHSPDDLTIVSAVSAGRSFDWLKWLPHLRSVTSPVAGPHLAHDSAFAEQLIAAVVDVVSFRSSEQGPGRKAGHERWWPRVLLVIDATLGVDPAVLARVLDLGPTVGVSTLWIGARAADVPHQASTVLALAGDVSGVVRGRLWSTDPETSVAEVEIECLGARLAERAARALAPLRDASTAPLATSIPRTVDLLDVLDAEASTAVGIMRRWFDATSYGLAFPIGVGATGPTEIDLVHDGPHALVGGTSGSGKSELLQSMVAALASRSSSRRLNFLFVDYKGGAASKVFERLPHTVGYVTNLSTGLAGRALTSLRAELHHRMALMEGRAKDLEEMLRVAPDEAPPSLVIVVDEFAAIVNEVPEFVTGMVDIAQRGRSLGIHLVLATQRPSGAVDEHILANTNLRISLRMLDRSESIAVIGSAEAVDIPVPLRGRAFARLGAQHLVPFQSAYGGAAMVTTGVRRPVLVADFDGPHATPRPPNVPAAAAASASQLDAVIDAIVVADRALGLPPPRRPWCDPLPDVVELSSLLTDPRCGPAHRHPGRVLAVGLLDVPEHQEQHPALVDLEEGGGWLVFGSGGAGKTTLLRTVAASVALAATPAEAAVLVFDFASRGLVGLRQLPNVVDVATGDDLEAVTRHIVSLDHELHRRRAVLAASSAEHLTAYNERHDPMSRIVVIVDGLGGALDALDGSGAPLSGPAEPWGDRFVRILVDGRQVGIHAVVASDRRRAVPTRLHGAVSNRLVLRHADESAYAEHGIGPSTARTLELGAGRGLWQAATTVQIAVVSGDDVSARGQHDALSRLAERVGPLRTNALATEALAERVPRSALASVSPLGPHEVPVGIADVSGEPAILDLGWSNAVVAGPPRSGRSTALTTIAIGLATGCDVFGVGPPLCGLVAAGLERGAFGDADAIAPLLDRLAGQLSAGRSHRPTVLVVDDLDALDHPLLNVRFARLAAHDGLRIVASVDGRTLAGFTTDPFLVQLKRARRMLLLQPDDPAEFVQLTGVRMPHRPGVASVPGRGVLLSDRVSVMVQVAVPGLGRSGRHGGGPRPEADVGLGTTA